MMGSPGAPRTPSKQDKEKGGFSDSSLSRALALARGCLSLAGGWELDGCLFEAEGERKKWS